MSQRIVILAILVAASAVPAFDYAITRVGDDVRAGRLASFDTITAGTAPAPYRYRVLVPYTIAPFLCGLVASLLTLRGGGARRGADAPPKNPLQLRAALQMALLFQVVLVAAFVARQQFGAAGVFSAAALVGLTDVDAVTVSMARLLGDGFAAADAAQAVVIAIIANTLLKLGLAAAIGRGVFRLTVVAGLAAMTVALLIPLLVPL